MNYQQESKQCLARIFEHVSLQGIAKTQQKLFKDRLERYFPELFSQMLQVYGQRYDLHYHLQALAELLIEQFKQRSPALKRKDKMRLDNPHWFKSEQMLGMACYVDLVAEDLADLQTRIPYFEKLGITYLHLMPLYKSPEGDNDGGYAVSDYRQVSPNLGTMQQLKKLATALDKAGMSLVLDFVFNHTADDHEWALAAKQGDETYQQYYYMFDDRTTPNQYEQSIREIFPQVRRGSFTFNEDTQKWVWTTFNSFQWDLNYSNPSVFRGIVGEMLFLANIGCDVLRLDALAFIWKQMGTSCESQPKAHLLIQAFNTCLKIAAPSVLFKSEAIVHPDEVAQYIDKDECQLSYNPLLMALLWNSLATRKTRLLTQSLSHRFKISSDCSWVNYARCHDDIGWTFDDGDAGHLGINGYDHRQFLNRFYTGRFPGSFATGVPFQENPQTGDCRVCGSLASLVGLEQALQQNSPAAVDEAVKRIMLLHSVLLSIGGIPLLYQGDELAALNDYSYLNDEHKKHDARWVNRPKITQAMFEAVERAGTLENRVFTGLTQLVQIRKQHAVFGDAATEIIYTNNQHVFAFKRQHENGQTLLVLVNFTEREQAINNQFIQDVAKRPLDLIEQQAMDFAHSQITVLKPYQFRWLLCE
ncbi:alpha amylase [Catenovulum agarivorans DS-2]|uniref:Alpha amylase n=1 Tax=Catenovulum agarivorans DS-2 TaxID=1328313 RepID=W7QSE4_9ALTE|nr:alpha-amylase family glycosyl hydrolase [Catenovulum agarivorans]EWH08315.1 alpha amylase [Catenovulum agarivorans DS-2]